MGLVMQHSSVCCGFEGQHWMCPGACRGGYEGCPTLHSLLVALCAQPGCKLGCMVWGLTGVSCAAQPAGFSAGSTQSACLGT